MADGELTAKQKAFVLAYVGEARFNASEAARIAGYADRTSGPRLLSNANISSRVREELESLALTAEQNLSLVREDALKTDEEIIRTAAKAFEDAGIPAGASMISSLVTARTSARTNLLRVHGNLANRLDVKHSGRVDHVHRMPEGLQHLSDDDMDALEAMAQKIQRNEIGVG